jgi:hypothetical protein
MNVRTLAGVFALFSGVVGTAHATTVGVDQFVVYKNGTLIFNDTFDDPSGVPDFVGAIPASYSQLGIFDEFGGKAYFNSATGQPVIANTVNGAGATIFANDLVRISRLRLNTNTNSTNFTNGLKSDDDLDIMALFDVTAPITRSSSYGLTLSDSGGDGNNNGNLRATILRGTNSGAVGVSAWRFDGSQSPSVSSENVFVPAALGNDQILFRQRTAANDNTVFAEFAYINGPIDLSDPGAIAALNFQSLGAREAFDGEQFVRAELRMLERVAEINLLQMTTGSPTSIAQTVDTGSTPFEMNFNYRFETPTGLLEVILDGQTIFSDLMSGPVSEEFRTANILIGDPLLLDLVGATLEFRVTNPGSDPSTVSIDSVLFPGIVNGDFGNDTNGWLITATDPSNVGVLSLRNNAVPEPAALMVFGIGLAGFGLAARRRRKAA